MAIIPRANPGDITRIAPLPGVRNTTRVSAEPVAQLADAARGVQRVATDIYQQHQDRADLASYMGAQRQLSDWRDQWNDPNNETGITSYKGRDALKLHDTILPDFDKRAGEIANNLPSQRAREKFMAYATGERDNLTNSVNRYATAQNDAYIATERKLYDAGQQNDLINAQLNDPNRYRQLMASTLDTIYADTAANGEPSKLAEQRIRALESGVHAGVMSQLMATGKARAARDYYSENADQFLEADRARALSELQPLVDDEQADADADAALGGGAFDPVYEPPARGKPSAAIQSAIEDAAKAHGVPAQYLFALAEQESSFRPDAVNPEALDDGDHATGIMQYRQSTADALGIDRTDPVASINAAAKEFRERMDKGGPAFAIAAHFAGDAGADAVVNRGRRAQNPRTAHYVDEVMGRAQRWAGAQGATDSAPEQAATGRVSLGMPDDAGALEAVQAIPDKHRRDLAEAKVRDRITIRKLREAEADRTTVEQINTAVWTAADPSLPLPQVIGTEAFAYAARKGLVGELENNLKYRMGNPVRKDNAEVVGAYLDTLHKNPEAFAHMDVMKNARHMTEDTAKQLVKLQADIRDGKGQSDAATENEQLDALVYGPLKLVGETTAAKKGRAEFETAWYQMKIDWSRNHDGKAPDADARDGMIRRLRAAFALKQTKGFADKFDISAQDRKAIIAAFARRGVTNPTDAQINSAYLVGGAR